MRARKVIISLRRWSIERLPQFGPFFQRGCKDMNLIAYFCHMKIEEAIVYCLATSNRGMRTEQIADMINRQRLHLRKDGQPVTSKQVYAVISQHRSVFCYAEGRIMLMI